MLPFTIPSALLLTVCLVYGRLAGDQEVTAAKAAGISVMTLLWPALLLSGVLCGLSLVLTDQVIPWALGRIEHIVLHTMEDVFLERLRTEHRFIDRRRGMQITVADVRGRTLIRPVIRHIPKAGRTYTLMADEATISLDVVRQQAQVHVRHGLIDLPHGDRLLVHEQTERFSLANEIGKPKPRNLPIAVIEQQMQQTVADDRSLQDRRLIAATLSLTTADFAGLSDLPRWKAPPPGEHSANYHRLRTEIHSRYALSCSCLFFVLFGGPFAIYRSKSQFLTSFLYCFVPIVAVYYPLIMGLMARAKRGDLDPSWGMWLGNALLLAAGIVILRRVLRH
jgi:lipopolysaccharide export system permease protein